MSILKQGLDKLIFEEKEGSRRYSDIAKEFDRRGAPVWMVNAFKKMAQDELKHAVQLKRIARSIVK